MTTELTWLADSLQDTEQWAAVMTHDADGKPIDWDWVRALNLAGGVGAGAELDVLHDNVDVHELLVRDYAIRDRIEAMLADMTSVFMGDFDRNISSFRLARALAYANRRLNDEIALLIERGVRDHLWTVERRFDHGTAIVVLHGIEDEHARDIEDRSAQLSQERSQRRKQLMRQRSSGSQMMQQASLSAFSDDSALAEKPDVKQVVKPARSKSSHDWREAYLPGRDVDEVLGIDIETTGTNAWRDYILDVGFERMNMSSPQPQDAQVNNIYAEAGYAADGAYDQSRLSFGVPARAAVLGNPFILQLTGIDVSKRANEPLFDEWGVMQSALLARLVKQPYVAHNATFEHKYFMANVAGYAEAYRDGNITIIDTLPMSRFWDEGSVASEQHPYGDNTLDAYAKRQGALNTNSHERHLGLEDSHIMLVAMRNHLHWLREHNEGPWGAAGRSGVGGKHVGRRTF